LENPGRSHWEAVKRVFRYLKATSNLALVYERTGRVSFAGYTDSDWGGDLDTRKSASAYVMLMGNAAVSWKRQLQGYVALSSTEAEFISSTMAAREILWMKGILEELGYVQGCVQMYTDNQGSLKLMKNPVGHTRMKQIEIVASCMRDLVEKEEFTFAYVHTDSQVADCLTKAIPGVKQEKANQLLGLKVLPSN
jgi:hypothetical protein